MKPEAESTTETLSGPEATESVQATSAPEAGATDGKSFQDGMREALETEANKDAKAETAPEAAPQEDTTQQTTEVQPEAETLYAGKYKSVDDLQDGYKHLERKLGEMGQYKHEVDTLKQQLAELSGLQERQAQQQQPEWEQEWSKHPLATHPNALTQPREYEEWVNNTFVPHFQNDPHGTVGFMIEPKLQELAGWMQQEFERRDQEAQIQKSVESWYSSPADWTGEKTVGQQLAELPPEGQELYNSYLQENVPPQHAAKLVFFEMNTGQVQAQNTALRDKDQELRDLASGAPARGPAPATPRAAGNENPLDFRGNVAAQLRQAGHDLGDYQPPFIHR